MASLTPDRLPDDPTSSTPTTCSKPWTTSTASETWWLAAMISVRPRCVTASTRFTGWFLT